VEQHTLPGRKERCNGRSKGAKIAGIGRMTIFDKAIFTDVEDIPGQGSLFPQIAKLSEQFLDQLTAHPGES
jgi:hypothetical protein